MSALRNIEIHFTFKGSCFMVSQLYSILVSLCFLFEKHSTIMYLLVSHTNIMLPNSDIETNIQSSCHECKTATDSQELALLIVSFCSVED